MGTRHPPAMAMMRSTSAGFRWQRTASAPTSSATKRVDHAERSHSEPSSRARTRACAQRTGRRRAGLAGQPQRAQQLSAARAVGSPLAAGLSRAEEQARRPPASGACQTHLLLARQAQRIPARRCCAHSAPVGSPHGLAVAGVCGWEGEGDHKSQGGQAPQAARGARWQGAGG